METHTFVADQKTEDGPLLRLPNVYVPRRSRHDVVQVEQGHVEPADRHSAYLPQQRKPMEPKGRKYPNYEPFHPPPREDFQYPHHMRPPQQSPYKAKQTWRSSSSSPISTRSSRSSSGSRSYDDRRSYHRHYRRSRSRSRSWTRSMSSTSRSRSSRTSRSLSRSIDTYSSCSTITNRIHSPRSFTIDDKTQDYLEDAEEESDDNSEEDLEQELHPLSFHAHNRKKLLLEAVRSLKGNKLRDMMPDVLKDLPPEKLMDECLKILESMDYATVIDILEGKNVPKIDSPSPSHSHKEKKKSKKSHKHKSKKKKKKRKSSPASPAPDPSSSSGTIKKLMELLELEYRAKAIRALLKRHGVETVEFSETTTVQENETQIPHTAVSPKEPEENTENLSDKAELNAKEDAICQDEESSSSSKFLAASSSSSLFKDAEKQETDEDSLPPLKLQDKIESDGGDTGDDVLELFVDNLAEDDLRIMN